MHDGDRDGGVASQGSAPLEHTWFLSHPSLDLLVHYIHRVENGALQQVRRECVNAHMPFRSPLLRRGRSQAFQLQLDIIKRQIGQEEGR